MGISSTGIRSDTIDPALPGGNSYEDFDRVLMPIQPFKMEKNIDCPFPAKRCKVSLQVQRSENITINQLPKADGRIVFTTNLIESSCLDSEGVFLSSVLPVNAGSELVQESEYIFDRPYRLPGRARVDVFLQQTNLGNNITPGVDDNIPQYPPATKLSFYSLQTCICLKFVFYDE
jgi:hypothetical protein